MKRGLNLGCGNIILPCEQPVHHRTLPTFLYSDPEIEWDNVDWNEGPGVDKVVDLFNYPWQGLEDNTYDYCIAAHIVEHIPHHIVWEGQFVHRHPEYQDGWFAWFAQLWRVMKHGGTVWLLAPYAWSNSGISDPTHTRYLTPATINYFNNATDENPAFRYRMHQRWDVNMKSIAFFPHELAIKMSEVRQRVEHDFDLGNYAWELAQTNLNMVADFSMDLRAIKE